MRLASSIAVPCSLVCSFFFLAGVPFPRGERTTTAELAQPVNEFKDSGHDFSTTLSYLSQKYKLRMGIDLEAPLKRATIGVNVAHGTVRDALQAIVAQEPGYRWGVVDDVINVTAKQDRDSVLDVEVARFQVANVNTFGIHKAIVSLPELESWLTQNGVRENSPTYVEIIVGKNGLGLPRASLDLKRTTLRAILNSVVGSPGFRSWTVARWGPNGQYLSIGVN